MPSPIQHENPTTHVEKPLGCPLLFLHHHSRNNMLALHAYTPGTDIALEIAVPSFTADRALAERHGGAVGALAASEHACGDAKYGAAVDDGDRRGVDVEGGVVEAAGELEDGLDCGVVVDAHGFAVEDGAELPADVGEGWVLSRRRYGAAGDWGCRCRCTTEDQGRRDVGTRDEMAVRGSDHRRKRI
jgi:hypothetical protein